MDAWSRLRGIVVSRSPLQLTIFVMVPLSLVFTAWWLLRAPASPVEAGLPRAVAATVPPSVPAPPDGSSGSGSVGVVVQIAGAVRRPGVYQLVAGARVVDLLEAAGGADVDADPDAMALASVLVDGQRVVVPRRGEVVPAADLGATPVPAGTSVPGPLDLNLASADQLDELPGVGPATAAAIVAHRERDGPFRSVDDLLDVRGIGPAKLDALAELVTV